MTEYQKLVLKLLVAILTRLYLSKSTVYDEEHQELISKAEKEIETY